MKKTKRVTAGGTAETVKIDESFEEILSETLGDNIKRIKSDQNTADFARKPKPKPIPKQSLKDEAAVLEDSLREEQFSLAEAPMGEDGTYLKSGLQINVLRKLKRGFWAIQDELDLHGSTSGTAKELVGNFLSEANREPVLKNKLFVWLQMRNDILAYCPARQSDGGSGATILLLSNSRGG
jgi:DNA-nicking Smr family endonuclease